MIKLTFSNSIIAIKQLTKITMYTLNGGFSNKLTFVLNKLFNLKAKCLAKEGMLGYCKLYTQQFVV